MLRTSRRGTPRLYSWQNRILMHPLYVVIMKTIACDMITFPNAKINLGLNIVARRPDGYHDIETVFYPIGLTDVLEVVPSRNGVTRLHTLGNKVDCEPEKNLVMKAFRLMKSKVQGLQPVEIYLYKHIPDGAGLGGGSADASFMLKMLDEMSGAGLVEDELAALASQLGADCAFFVHNTPMYATGIGNRFSPVTVDLSGYVLLLVKPPVSVSTAAAYAKVKPHASEQYIPEVLQRPVEEWRDVLKNDFEPSVFAQFPQLAAIKQSIYDSGALYASMSGSGSSLFGIYDNDILAENASREIAGGINFVMKL